MLHFIAKNLKLQIINIKTKIIMSDNKLNRYGLAYNYVPMLLDNVLNHQENGGLAVMAEKSFFVKMADKMNLDLDGFTWDDFNIEIEDLDENNIVLLYHFPEPKVQPEAKYGALVFDKTINQV